MTLGRMLIPVVLATVMLVADLWAADTLKINTSIKPPFSTAEMDGFFDRLLVTLFSRNGIAIELVRLPPERALHYVNEGVSDGEVPRIGGLSKTYPNIVQVPEKLIDYHFVAFSQPRPLPDMSFDVLQHYRVGLLIGWKIYETRVPPDTVLSRLTGPLQLFLMLANDRIDVGLYERYAGHYLIRSNGFTDIYECRPPLAVRPMFLYLNRKHASLAMPLAESLRAMNADGTLAAIKRATLDSIEACDRPPSQP